MKNFKIFVFLIKLICISNQFLNLDLRDYIKEKKFELDDLYGDFRLKFEKYYPDFETTMLHRDNFENNIETYIDKGQIDELEKELNLNPFLDMSWEEFQKKYLMDFDFEKRFSKLHDELLEKFDYDKFIQNKMEYFEGRVLQTTFPNLPQSIFNQQRDYSDVNQKSESTPLIYNENTSTINNQITPTINTQNTPTINNQNTSLTNNNFNFVYEKALPIKLKSSQDKEKIQFLMNYKFQPIYHTPPINLISNSNNFIHNNIFDNHIYTPLSQHLIQNNNNNNNNLPIINNPISVTPTSQQLVQDINTNLPLINNQINNIPQYSIQNNNTTNSPITNNPIYTPLPTNSIQNNNTTNSPITNNPIYTPLPTNSIQNNNTSNIPIINNPIYTSLPTNSMQNNTNNINNMKTNPQTNSLNIIYPNINNFPKMEYTNYHNTQKAPGNPANQINNNLDNNQENIPLNNNHNILNNNNYLTNSSMIPINEIPHKNNQEKENSSNNNNKMLSNNKIKVNLTNTEKKNEEDSEKIKEKNYNLIENKNTINNNFLKSEEVKEKENSKKKQEAIKDEEKNENQNEKHEEKNENQNEKHEEKNDNQNEKNEEIKENQNENTEEIKEKQTESNEGIKENQTEDNEQTKEKQTESNEGIKENKTEDNEQIKEKRLNEKIKKEYEKKIKKVLTQKLIQEPKEIVKRKYKISEELKDFPKKKSWIEYATKIFDQMECAACYATSVVAALEMEINKKYKMSVSLSTQEIIDCSEKNQGCTGGDPYLAFKYIEDNGISYDYNYPYINMKGICLVETLKNFKKLRSKFKMYFLDNPVDLIKGLNYGPIVVVHHANKSLMNYAGGIFNPDREKCNGKLNHAALAVGYDLTGDIPFLIVKNAWGELWGEKGYYRISLDDVIREGKGICKMFEHKSNIIIDLE